MLQPIKHILDNKLIVLASSSPRRIQVLENIGLNVTSLASKFEENLNPEDFDSFGKFVEATALGKAQDVSRRLRSESKKCADLIIAADTVVTLDGNVYGKPKSKEEAVEMLTKLSGKTNTVYTGVVLLTGDGKIESFTESTDVVFGDLAREQIVAYVETGEPMDKAGAYGIQGIAGSFVKRINGDYFTVTGLPLYRLCDKIYGMYKHQ